MRNNIAKLILTVTIISGIACNHAFAETMTMKGSTTVLPIAQATAEAFMKDHSGADISVQGGGSGVGVAALIDKTCDIADSSRAMKDAEIEQAVNKGVEPKANVIAMDGIVVVVNPANKVSALTKQQVMDIYTGKISDWSQIGGDTGKIIVVSRDSSSGTYEAFGVLALKNQIVRSDALLQASNQAVATTVTNTPNAIGYVGIGYVSKSVKALPIEGVTASADTVLSNKYPYSRPLYMYTNGEPKRLVKEFIDFVLSDAGQKLVEESGYVALSK